MTGLEIKEALRAGQRVYGTLIVSSSPRWVVPVKNLGLDFVFIDTEHIALDREKLSWMCHAYREAGLAPIVRIPSPDPYAATMAIDGGAVGIVAPYIETATEVRQLVGALKYRPIKGQRLQGFISETHGAGDGLRSYLEDYNREHIFMANIESVPGMESLDDILAVEQLDGVVVGPHDLSCSLGIPEQYMNAEFVEAAAHIIEKARECGKGAGIHMVYRTGLEQEIQLARSGANFILHSGDIMAFQTALHDDLEQIRAALGDEAKDEGVRSTII
jgi:4-hydroxy-2-oxoheptanedioate aldolase